MVFGVPGLQLEALACFVGALTWTAFPHAYYLNFGLKSAMEQVEKALSKPPRYRVGQAVESPHGKERVTQVTRAHHGASQHPRYKDLTPEQRKLLDAVTWYDVEELERVPTDKK